MTEELSTTDAPTAADLVAEKLPPLAVVSGVTALVRKPEDVAEANSVLLAWVTQQIERLEAERDDAQTNLDQALKMKVKASGWKRQVKLWNGRVVYYQKMKAALEQGYFIMPDLPNVIDVFAVRTDRKTVNQCADGTWKHAVRVDDIESKPLPEGEGRFVDPSPIVDDWSDTETYKPHGSDVEKTRERYYVQAMDLDEAVDFPVKLVKPQVLDATGKALAGKLFDELGIIRPHAGATRKGDPIVVGRIQRKENGKTFGCSFIVHWWVDTRDL